MFDKTVVRYTLWATWGEVWPGTFSSGRLVLPRVLDHEGHETLRLVTFILLGVLLVDTPTVMGLALLLVGVLLPLDPFPGLLFCFTWMVFCRYNKSLVNVNSIFWDAFKDDDIISTHFTTRGNVTRNKSVTWDGQFCGLGEVGGFRLFTTSASFAADGRCSLWNIIFID